MKRYQRLFIKAGTAVAAYAAPYVALAQTNPFTNAQTQVGTIYQKAGFAGTTPDLPTIVGRIINVVLGFLGVLLLAYLLYAGFLWMTAGGETEKVDQAKTMIKNAIVGLIIIIAAFA